MKVIYENVIFYLEDAKNQFGGGFFHKKEDGLSVLDETIVKSKKEKVFEN